MNSYSIDLPCRLRQSQYRGPSTLPETGGRQGNLTELRSAWGLARRLRDPGSGGVLPRVARPDHGDLIGSNRPVTAWWSLKSAPNGVAAGHVRASSAVRMFGLGANRKAELKRYLLTAYWRVPPFCINYTTNTVDNENRCVFSFSSTNRTNRGDP